MVKIYIRSLLFSLIIPVIFNSLAACGNNSQTGKRGLESSVKSDSGQESDTQADYNPVNTLLVLPENPAPGEGFRILATGEGNILNAKIIVSGQSGILESLNSKTGGELPYWRIAYFAGSPAGKYKATLIMDKKEISNLEFEITPRKVIPPNSAAWKTTRGWDSGMETIYSSWINALFQGCDEQASWSALHEVTQNKDRNFLYNYLSMGEDDPKGKNRVIMEPDCADNPFYLRAYFAWKLGLPFGYHICDRGFVGHNPRTGQWITNETSSSKDINPVMAFNSFLRSVMNGVHSGTARTALDNENSDYYPVSLERSPATRYRLCRSLWAHADTHKLGTTNQRPSGTASCNRCPTR